MKTNSWENYAVGSPSAVEGHHNVDCMVLNTISHIAHIETAIRILKDKVLTGHLFYGDWGEYKNDHIYANWFSPNFWKQGSRYGNIEFVLDFEKSVQAKRYYWVPPVTEYTPHACRILITADNYDGIFEQYNPRIKTGPWYYDAATQTHYWNSKYCLEFMYEGYHFDIKDIEKINFLDHHPTFCNSRNYCEQRGMSGEEAGIKFVASLLIQKLPVYIRFFRISVEKKGVATDTLQNAVLTIQNLAAKETFDGIITHDHPKALAILKASLYFLSVAAGSEFSQMVSMFQTSEDFNAVLTKLVKKHFSLDVLFSE